MNPIDTLPTMTQHFNLLVSLLEKSKKRNIHCNVVVIDGKHLYDLHPGARNFLDSCLSEADDRVEHFYWDPAEPRLLSNERSGRNVSIDLQKLDASGILEGLAKKIAEESEKVFNENYDKDKREEEIRFRADRYRSAFLNQSSFPPVMA